MTASPQRVALRGPLHARPAGLLARLLATYDADVRVNVDGRAARARSVLDLLSLEANEGDTLEIVASGPDATAALATVVALVERNIDQALVPEAARPLVPGIAIGRAALLTPRSSRSGPSLGRTDELSRMRAALARARRDLDELLVHLPPAERPLLAPEAGLIDAIEPLALAAVRGGLSAEDAVLATTGGAEHDLLVDARSRLLDALEGESALAVVVDPGHGPAILVVRTLTPTLVARLPPPVVGVVVLVDDVKVAEVDPSGRAAGTSHAVLLARGRGIPVAFAGAAVATSLTEGAWMIVEASVAHARVWVNPDGAWLDEARARRARAAASDHAESLRAAAPLRHIELRIEANVSTLGEVVPDGAEGVGLVRTELLFAGRSRAPSLGDQLHAYAQILAGARGGKVTIRLFDGGADKPLDWLSAPPDDQSARGIALLRGHADVLATQLRAIAALDAVAPPSSVRLLVPMVRTVDDITHVRLLASRAIPVGAMVESSAAVDGAASLARAADFLSIGTNDLEHSLGARARGRVFEAVRRVVAAAHEHGKQVTVCGELAAEVGAALALAGLGVDAISVAPSRFFGVKLGLQSATAEECLERAREALGVAVDRRVP
jgi:phosphotransferase system HPr (HPr) family protein